MSTLRLLVSLCSLVSVLACTRETTAPVDSSASADMSLASDTTASGDGSAPILGDAGSLADHAAIDDGADALSDVLVVEADSMRVDAPVVDALTADMPSADTASSGGETDDQDAIDFDSSAAPEASWDTVPATLSLAGGIEVIDPMGALTGMTVTARALSLSSVTPERPAAIVAWDLQPSARLSHIVYVRFPLPVARRPGDLLELWTKLEGENEWFAQSTARVMSDGRRAIVAMWHFSTHATEPANIARRAFINGTDCTGTGRVVDDAGVLDVTETLPADSNESVTVGPRQIAYTHDLGLCVLTRMSGEMVFKEDSSPDPEPHRGEDYYGDANMVAPMRTLAEAVLARSCGYLRLRITEAFDSTREHTGSSMHFEGRGADITLCAATPGIAGCNTPLDKYVPGYGRLTRLAFQSGFQRSFFEDNADNAHVHVSVTRNDATLGRLAMCRNRGALGAVRSFGARGLYDDEGRVTRLPGNGGNVRFEPMGYPSGSTEAGRQPSSSYRSAQRMSTSIRVETGENRSGLRGGADLVEAGLIAIYGTVNFSRSTIISCGYSFYLAPSGRINCPGCDLTIYARSGVRLDGIVDLSATDTSSLRNGGNLTVRQPVDLAPVVELPTVDVRGADGVSSVVTPGPCMAGRGGDVSVIARGDLTLGASVPGVTGFSSRHDLAPPGESGIIFSPSMISGIITSGGIGASGGPGILMYDGCPGGAGGNIDLSVERSGSLGRASFFNAFVASGGTPETIATSPIEVIYNQGHLFNPEYYVGVGSLGGECAGDGKASRNRGSGGRGGAAGTLRIHVADIVSACPPLGAPSRFPLVGINGTGSVVGDMFQSLGGGCSLTWSAAGGSGGPLIYNLGRGPGTPGLAGASSVPQVP